MHEGSIAIMEVFVARYLSKAENISILDVGSRMIKGQELTYKTLFTRPGWSYTGADIEAGDNVDVVLQSQYGWQFPSNSFNIVISGQVLEHVEYPWIFMSEVARVMKRKGLACIIAPASWHMHRYPIDCYRYYPDGMIALAKWAGLRAIKARRDAMNGKHEQSTYLFAQKP